MVTGAPRRLPGCGDRISPGGGVGPAGPLDTSGVTGLAAALRVQRHARLADAVLALVVLAVSVPPLREAPGCGCPPTTA